ncbi:skin secretory protein xP2-like [Pollicipes pollicipes]|uniref:skin secretory protein xP2-like n=1 Tax=Pollicipes pollicipes TaxID=41117 RepID=UPI001885448C|nr:skin secretory protein xP2-like [Pollicipes pollicipes]
MYVEWRHKRQYGPPRAYSITEVTTRPSQGGGADPAPTPTGVASYQGYPIPAAPPIEAVDQQLVAGPQPTYFQAETPQPQPTYSQPGTQEPQPTAAAPQPTYSEPTVPAPQPTYSESTAPAAASGASAQLRPQPLGTYGDAFFGGEASAAPGRQRQRPGPQPQYREPGLGVPGDGGFLMPWNVPSNIQMALRDGLRPGW